jgi:hypothetical protein
METGAAADRRAEAERYVSDKSVINIHLLIAFAKIFGSRIEIVGSENSKESCQLCFDFERSVGTDASGGRMPLHGYITQTTYTLFSCRYVLNHPLFDASLIWIAIGNASADEYLKASMCPICRLNLKEYYAIYMRTFQLLILYPCNLKQACFMRCDIAIMTSLLEGCMSRQ